MAAAAKSEDPFRKVFVARWTGFVAATWVMAFCGALGFSNFSTALKDVLSLNQKQLNRLSVAKDFGDSCGIIAGILSNFVPAPALLCIGACVTFVGNGTLWLIVSQRISAPPYWAVLVVCMIQGNSYSWLNTSVFRMSVNNFPRNRGPVVGLFKAYMGLSAAIYSTFSSTFFASSASMYLLMLTTMSVFFCIIMAIFCRDVPAAENEEDVKAEQQSLLVFNLIAGALAVMLITQNLVPALSEGVGLPLIVGLVFVMLAAPALVPVVIYAKMKRQTSNGVVQYLNGGVVGEDGKEAIYPSTNVVIEKDELKEPLLACTENGADIVGPEDWKDAANEDNEVLEAGKGMKWASTLGLGEDWSTLSLFRTWHSYVFYFSLFCGTGMGMSVSNNLGQIGQSFGYETVTVFTSLYSLGNFFGRLLSGNISEYFLKAMGTPRPGWMGVAKLFMIGALVWMWTGSGTSLYVGSLLIGFAHGSHVTLGVPTNSEFYGVKYFGTNYMVINTHLVAGSMIFSGVIAGYLYDKYGSYAEGETTLTCYGSLCYGTTFKIYVGFLSAALLVDALLSFISRPLYRKLQDINSRVTTSHETLKHKH